MPWVLPAALAALIAPTVLMLAAPNLSLRTVAVLTAMLTAVAWCGWLFELDPRMSAAQPLACCCASGVCVWLVGLAFKPFHWSVKE